MCNGGLHDKKRRVPLLAATFLLYGNICNLKKLGVGFESLRLVSAVCFP